MYTVDQITHILFLLWPSETNNRNMRHTQALGHTHVHTLQALCNDKHSDKYTLMYQKHKLMNVLVLYSSKIQVNYCLLDTCLNTNR